MQAPKTYLNILIDRSGSMYDAMADVIAGYAKVIGDLQKATANAPGDVILNTFTFDDIIDHVVVDKNVQDASKVLHTRSRGGTATDDALQRAIGHVLREVNGGHGMEVEAACMTVCFTDGCPNNNVISDLADLHQTMKVLQASGQFSFAFVAPSGVYQRIAQRYGVPTGNMTDYNNAAKGFDKIAAALTTYVQEREQGETDTDHFFAT